MVSGATVDETGGDNSQDIQRPGGEQSKWVWNKKEEYTDRGVERSYSGGSLRDGEAFVAAWVFAAVHILCTQQWFY